jgi:Mce-associated membrane protein
VAAVGAYDALMPGLDTEAHTRGSASLPVLVGSAAVVVALTGSALAALGVRQVSRSDDRSALRQQVLAVGRQIAVDFSAYDYRHLKQDFDRVVNESTGGFRKEFQTSSAGLQDVIIKIKAVSTAEVASAGVVTASPTDATVLVAVNRRVTNTSAPNGQSDSFGLQLTLRHIGGRWLASKIQPL